MFLVYILQSGNRSYIGMTNDFFKRWKQHNGILKGGAKYTTNNNQELWSPICIIDGFKDKKEAMQCEWKLKRKKGYYNRLKNLSYLLQTSKQWTSKSPNIKDQNLTIYIVNNYKHLLSSIQTKELVWF